MSAPESRSPLPLLFFGAVTGGVRLLVWILCTVFLVRIVPYFDDAFLARNMWLPAPTVLFLNASRYMQNYWYLCVPIFLLDSAITAAMQFLPDRRRWIRGFWKDAFFVTAILFLFLGSVSMMLPFTINKLPAVPAAEDNRPQENAQEDVAAPADLENSERRAP